jgi:glycerophosphoryl diester phosphodiesterase
VIDLRRRDGRVLRVGHRGAAALEPENTLRSVARAVELGVDLVEFDVLDLTDGTLVLAHSDNLFEVSHGAARGRVRPRSLDELREVAPELPTLDEALAFFVEQAPGTGLHIDLKCYGRELPLVEALRRHGVLERSVVSSFAWRSIRRVRAAEAALVVAIGYPQDRFGVARRRVVEPLIVPALRSLRHVLPRRVGRWIDRTGSSAAMLHFAVLSRAAVDRCHERGAAVFAWTVNDRATVAAVVEMGVDGVISDDPRVLGS